MVTRDVNFGISLPNFVGNSYQPGPVEQYYPIEYAFPLNDSFSWDQLTTISTSAERLGYSSLWASDHFMLGKANFEAWTTLTALAAITRRVKLGTFMSCDGYRNPAVVAKMAANLAIISSNRFLLGYGAGWYQPEFEAYGFQFPPLKERVSRMAEGLQIVRGMLGSPKFSFSGKHYVVKDAMNEPKPSARVPIFVGGGGKRTLRAAARFADGWDVGPDVKPARYASLVDYLKVEMKRQGRKWDEITRSMHFRVLLGRDEDELREKKRIVTNAVRDVDLSKASKSGPGDFNIEDTLIGTPSVIREKVRRYADLGCNQIVLVFMDYPRYDSPALFAETVMH
ncbi:MAG: LLM class flavin-dependent oxidoreductase [Thaumarchaeota archaeon]|nr:LLM class flavin-dependent oxidoreductase [Nitrososphaerota archaeon]